MDSETRGMILDTIIEVGDLKTNVCHLENMLWGLFDGYDYSEKIILSTELAQVTHENAELGAKISTICGIIKKYPTETFA
jgi:hypothetical protein